MASGFEKTLPSYYQAIEIIRNFYFGLKFECFSSILKCFGNQAITSCDCFFEF